MNIQHDAPFSVQLDANGHPDRRYYLATAQRLRTEATREWTRQASAALARWLQQSLHALHIDGHRAPLHH